VTHGVQNCLTHNSLIEGLDVPDEEAILKVLNLIPVAYLTPKLIIERQEPPSELNPLLHLN
jgi:hypothetical protein